MRRSKLIVIGGGAAGLMAAGQAAEQARQSGVEIQLLEKTARPGNKVRISGRGRCNLTNIAPMQQFLMRFGSSGSFLRQSFSRFFSTELRDFFAALEVPTVIEGEGRVFPASGRAQDVVEALVRRVRGCGATLLTGASVESLIIEDGAVTGVVAGSEASTDISGRNAQTYRCDAVIIATGGASYRGTGSNGDGYRLACSAGHHIVPVRPALIPLETAGDIAPRLQGVSLRHAVLQVFVDGRKSKDHKRACGEMLFTHFGLSGPLILDTSRGIVDALRAGRRVEVSIDLKPDLDERGLDAELLSRLNAQGRRRLVTLLRGYLPARLITVGFDLTGLSPEKTGNQVRAEERRRLRQWIKDFRLEISGHRPLDEAMVTAGGVETREVDPRTMASRLVKGLFFAGEVLDVDGDTGGFNLQAAFSTGWVAGRAAATNL